MEFLTRQCLTTVAWGVQVCALFMRPMGENRHFYFSVSMFPKRGLRMSHELSSGWWGRWQMMAHLWIINPSVHKNEVHPESPRKVTVSACFDFAETLKQNLKFATWDAASQDTAHSHHVINASTQVVISTEQIVCVAKTAAAVAWECTC